MKISIKIIESSSNGNCIVLDDGNKLLFLDFGTIKKNIIQFLGKNKKEINDIAGILLTHEHFDHFQSLKDELSSDLNVYSSKGTFDALDKKIKKIYFKKNIINNYDEYISIKNSN
jgi:metal-dependent hydrolase (beta-lactamase superfamily II)